MSAKVIESFLPWTVGALKAHNSTNPAWYAAFPPEVAAVCPAPIYTLPTGWGTLSVIWPLVAVWCLAGILGGFSLGAHLLRLSRHNSERVSGFFSWGLAFIWYGLMCLGALFTHCIPTDHGAAFKLLDVIATGCTGTSCIVGLLCLWRVVDDRSGLWRLGTAGAYAALALAALEGAPMTRDMVYVVPSFGLAAVAFSGSRLGWGAPSRAAEGWLEVSLAGAALALVSVVVDQWLCHLLGAHGSCLQWIFLGCDIALLGAFKAATAGFESSRPKSKSP